MGDRRRFGLLIGSLVALHVAAVWCMPRIAPPRVDASRRAAELVRRGEARWEYAGDSPRFAVHGEGRPIEFPGAEGCRNPGPYGPYGPFTIVADENGFLIRPRLPGEGRSNHSWNPNYVGLEDYVCPFSRRQPRSRVVVDLSHTNVSVECQFYPHYNVEIFDRQWVSATLRPIVPAPSAARVARTVVARLGIERLPAIVLLAVSLVMLAFAKRRSREVGPWLEAEANGDLVALPDGRTGRIGSRYVGAVLVTPPSPSVPFRSGETVFVRWLAGTFDSLAATKRRRQVTALWVVALGLLITFGEGLYLLLRSRGAS